MSTNENQLYIYRWGPRMTHLPGLASMGNRKGQLCRLLVRGGRNSAMVRFKSDGHEAVVSRNALRRVDRTSTKEAL